MQSQNCAKGKTQVHIVVIRKGDLGSCSAFWLNDHTKPVEDICILAEGKGMGSRLLRKEQY